MEVNSYKGRLFRNKSAILDLLQEQQQSGLSIQAFYPQHSIPSGSFHNWKKKYAQAMDYRRPTPLLRSRLKNL
jgi:hypothetical protein